MKLHMLVINKLDIQNKELFLANFPLV